MNSTTIVVRAELMKALSSLLVSRGIASERAVLEAARRQEIHGADLATSLLELGAAREADITALLAESMDVDPAPPGTLAPESAAVLRLIPGELAYRHAFFPLRVDGPNLVVAAAAPLAAATEEDLSFALGMGLQQVASPLVRIHQALAGFYGIPLDRRMARLLARLEGRPDPSPTMPPPADIIGVDAPALAPAPLSLTSGGGAAAGLEVWLRRAILDEKVRAVSEGQGAPERGAWQRRRGPFTAAMAEQELEGSLTADTVLDVFFAFARQFFAFSFLFTVHGDLAEGRNVSGVSAPSFDATALGVPLGLPSTLALARDRLSPVVAPFASDGIDAQLQRDLRRPVPPKGGPSFAAAVIPIVVRNRAVALLYGDDGDEPVELSLIGDVIAVTSLAAAALERLILRKKQSALRKRVTIAPSAHELVALRASGEEPGPPAGPPFDEPKAALIAAQLDLIPLVAPPADVEAAARREPPPAAPPDAQPPAPSRAIPPPPPSSSTRAALGDAALQGALSDPPAARSSRSPSSQMRRAGLPPEIEIGWSQLPPPLVPASRETLPVASLPGTVSFDEGDTYVGMGPDTETFSARSIGHTDDTPGSAPPTAPRSGVAPTSPSEAGSARAAEDDAIDAEWWSQAARPSRPSRPPSHRGFPRSAAFVADVPASLLTRRPLGRPIPREEQDAEQAPRPFLDDPPPAASASSSAAPRAPEPPRRAPPDLPALLAKVMARAPDSGVAFLTLVESAEPTMHLLMEGFPGPLVVDRHRALEQLPPASRCGPVLELIVAIGHPALPFITARSGSIDVETRFWATHLLGELWYTESAAALLPRLFDEDLPVRRVARRSAAALATEGGAAGAPMLQGLSHMARNIDEPTRRRVLAIETMGEIRASAMVPPLISALGDPSEDVVDAARRALLFVTRQDFGFDAKKWSAWWASNAPRHRVEWLIDALMHDDATIRRAAGEELKNITREYFGYYDDLPAKERERAQGHYRAWWGSEGRARFAAADKG